MARFKVHVTDHAVLRFMERALNVKLDDIRTYIATQVAEAADVGAANVVIEGVRYCFDRCDNEVRVTTVLGEGMTIRGRRQNHNEKKSISDGPDRRESYDAMTRRMKRNKRRAKK